MYDILTRGFADDLNIYAGCPVSEYSQESRPIQVCKYKLELGLLGISQHTIVGIDLTRFRVPQNCVCPGGLINIVQRGQVSIHKINFTRNKKDCLNKPVTITNDGLWTFARNIRDKHGIYSRDIGIVLDENKYYYHIDFNFRGV